MRPALSFLQRWRRRPASGLTLLEVLVVIAVLAAVVVYAVPAWQRHRVRLHRVDARTELVAIALRLQTCRASLSVYDNLVCTVQLPITTATGSYRVEGEVMPQRFRLVAMPLGEQLADACGEFRLDDKGVRAVTGSLATVECWGPED